MMKPFKTLHPFKLGVIMKAIASWSPTRLFSDPLTKGAWYDPSDYTTLYQDAAGTAPVTAVGQPVGLMLDKSKGLSVSATDALAGNGNFDTPAYWSDVNAVSTITGGQLVFNGSATLGGKYCIPSVVVGKYYEVSFDVVSISQGGIKVWVGVAQPVYTATTPGTHRYRIACTGDTFVRIYSNGTATTAVVDNVVVKEVFGNHAFNPSGNSANFPVLSARYNLLTKTEQFDDAVWKLFASTAKSGTTVCSLTFPTNSGSAIYAETIGTNAVSQTYTIRVMARAITAGKKIRLGIYTGVGNIESPDISLTSDFSEYTFTTPATTLTGVPSWFVKNDTAGTAGTIEFKQPSFCSSSDALNQPAYQRVNTSSDYDTVGFKPYLRFNDPARGTNNWLQTNSIDFTYGDKMFVSAGVRKLSDAAVGVICELSSDFNASIGAFVFSSEPGPTTLFGVRVSGYSIAQFVDNAAPSTRVLSTYSDLGLPTDDVVFMRKDGIVQTLTRPYNQNPTDNFGNYPMFIGARAGSSMWFNGRLYQLVVAGKQASANEITNTETFINQKTGAY